MKSANRVDAGRRRRAGMRSLFVLLWATLAGGVYAAAPTSVELAVDTLTLRFGDTDDWVRFSQRYPDTALLVQYSLQDPATLLLFNGSPIPMNKVKKWTIYFGAGNDILFEPNVRVPDLWIYCGPGNDQIKVPLGPGMAHVYGGPGNDRLEAEHHENNFLYGEEGDDYLSGGEDGDNYLDGGPGKNRLNSFDDSGVYPPAGRRQTHVYHQGSNDFWYEAWADNIYKFVSDGSNSAGSVTMMEHGGYDLLDFSAWRYPVNIDFAKTDPQVVSVDAQGNPILTFQFLFFKPNIEKVVWPNAPPQIVSAPWASPNPVTLPGSTAVNVVASDPDNGPSLLTYTWSLVSGPGFVTVNPNGTAASSTSTATFSAAGNYTLRVTVSDSALSVTGDVAVFVNAAPVPPAITTQPASRTVTAGQTASFSVVATGTAPLSYQWRKNGVNIPGATGSSYTTPATTTADSGSFFSVVVNNAAGSVTSGSASLTVNPAPVPPAITTQPASRTVTAGQTATFSVAATGTAPLAYQWRKNGVNIPGATGASYTTPATNTADSGALFSVVASNAAGSVTSANATLTVNPADTAGPALDVGSTVLKGTVSDPSGVASLTVNGLAVTVQPDGTWQKEVPLGAGTTSVVLMARDAVGNSTTRAIAVAK